MTAALRQDQLAQALKRGILAYRLLIIDEIGVPADGFESRPGAASKLGLLVRHNYRLQGANSH
jgi:hypothetical protein